MKKLRTDKRVWILLGGAFALCWLFVLQYGIFGSRVDWISQHSVLPDYFRRRFYATGNLFPDIAWNLGGGQNIYNFSYYGLYSPIILFSYFLPFVPMDLYIMGTSIVSYGVSAVFFYWWTKKHLEEHTAFWTSCMFALAGPMIFHSYNQIMFVNYMPFLCLAFIGTEKFLKDKKKGLLILGTVGMILTSFYFSIGGILALSLYGAGICIEQTEKLTWKGFWKKAGGFMGLILLCICLCGILLVPTVLVLLSRESGGNTAEGMGFFSVSLLRFFYSPYGLGLTALSLCSLIGNTAEKGTWKKKVIPAGLLVILFVPLFGYLLNGGLYTKDKVFIPFLPLVCMETGKYVDKLNAINREKGKKRFWLEIMPGIFLIGYSLIQDSVQGIDQKWIIGALGLVTAGDMLLVFLMQNFWKKYPKIPWPLAASCGILFFSGWAMNFQWQKMLSVQEYTEITSKGISQMIEETVETDKEWYRLEEQEGGTQEFADMNRIRHIRQNISSIYSSAYNQEYARFRNDTFQVNRHFRNRLMESVTDNPVFLKFMGVRYIIGKTPPAGYRLLKEKGDISLYQNFQAAPMAFVTNRTISREEYDNLSFPDRQTALLQYAVTEETSDGSQVTEDAIISMEKCSLRLPESEDKDFYIRKTDKGYEIYGTKERKIKAEISGRAETDDLLAVRFQVKNQNPGKDMYIRLNGQTNRLSAQEGYEYANENYGFSYTVTLKGGKKEVTFTLGEGRYILEDIQVFTGNLEELGNEELYESPLENICFSRDGDSLAGTVGSENTGYLITSIPYDKNFRITIDGEEVETEKVNTAFLGGKVPKGAHRIQISYQAPGKGTGFFLTGLGMVFLVSLELKSKRRKKSEQAV